MRWQARSSLPFVIGWSIEMAIAVKTSDSSVLFEVFGWLQSFPFLGNPVGFLHQFSNPFVIHVW